MASVVSKKHQSISKSIKDTFSSECSKICKYLSSLDVKECFGTELVQNVQRKIHPKFETKSDYVLNLFPSDSAFGNVSDHLYCRRAAFYNCRDLLMYKHKNVKKKIINYF
jgi:hypothetical protein